MKDLKRRAMRGGLARIFTQITTLVLRTGTLMIMARLLTPADFGLIGMVAAVINVFSVFRDFGLSAAAVQRDTISSEQSSTLFWINLLVGGILAVTAMSAGPVVAQFYHQPQLIGITAVLATAFLFNSAGVQHSALLERQMRFVTLAIVDITSLAIGTVIGILMALHGFGHWALVSTSTVTPLTYTVGVWIASGWIPGRPHKRQGTRSMMRFGGTLTLSGLIMYFAMNADKILLGRFWGVTALGVYGRAYQLVNIPIDNLNSAAGGVIFSALSRVQNEADRFRSYFLKGYSLILSLTVPITLICGLFGDDIIHVFLGSKWDSAIVVFRCLAPITLGLAILTPTGWLLSACGLVNRGLKLALVLAPVLVVADVIGLHWGPVGVAIAYSTAIILAVIPLIAWSCRGTPVSLPDLLQSMGRPVVSGIVAAIPALFLRMFVGPAVPAIPRLIMSVVVLCALYIGMLLYVLGQKELYMEIIRAFTRPASADEAVVLSA